MIRCNHHQIPKDVERVSSKMLLGIMQIGSEEGMVSCNLTSLFGNHTFQTGNVILKGGLFVAILDRTYLQGSHLSWFMVHVLLSLIAFD